MAEVLFTRGQSVGQKLERLIEASTMSFDAAFYRFNNERLARALDEARQRGVRIRLVVDRGKYQESTVLHPAPTHLHRGLYRMPGQRVRSASPVRKRSARSSIAVATWIASGVLTPLAARN